KLYISQRTMRSPTRLEPERLERGWQELLRAHDALRSRLLEVKGRVVQVVIDGPTNDTCEILDTAALSAPRRSAVLADLRERHAERLMAAESAPVAVGIVNTGDDS